MKTPKKSLAALLAMTLTVGLTACSGETDSQSAQSASSQPAQSASSSHTQEESGFPFTLTTKDGQEVTFTHVPETIISCNPNAGDELMALGLGDKIIATAYNNTQVNPQWREEYEAIPTVAESYISLETILSLEPDFVYGRSSSFSEKNNTTHDTLSGYGIMSLSSIEGYTVGADVDVVYQDFYDLGRIFQVEDRAEEIVSAMKEQIAAVEEAVAGAEPVKVFVYDMAQEGGALFPTLFVLTVPTYLPNLMLNYALKSVPATVSSIYTYLQPVLAIAISVGMGLDKLHADTVIFALVIFVGVGLVLRSYSVPPRHVDPPTAAPH